MSKSATKPRPKSAITQLDAYRPDLAGGDASVAIRLSVNEGALGASPKVREAIKHASTTDVLHRYPDQISHTLTQAIADFTGLDAARILPANGSDELISLLASAYINAGDEAIITQYGFLVFRQVIEVAGGTAVVAKDKNMTASVDAIIAAITSRTKLIFLANPNNPTGTALKRQDLARLIANIPPEIVLVIDGAYAEYRHGDAEYSDGAEFVESHANVVMLRTFSKIFGLAGLRLGWGYFPPDIYATLAKIRPAFSVNAIAAIAGTAAIQDRDFFDKSLAHNAHWLLQIQDSLRQAGFTPLPTTANFFLLKFASASQADAAHAFLLRRGILLRKMAGYGLPAYLRMSIGTKDEMIQVAHVFKDLAVEL
ncbi:MAG: aminotransferase class I/II-fold pyridoxal phosphate-dependent enzyme [Proteobacteria bacterium]|nr:aminotransferase class I/II-fold pyridoxal phosphate-dependent enzyme [Pseudomonadota bacterium]